MPRKRARKSNSSDCSIEGESNDDGTGRTINRRDYVKLASAATAMTAFGSTVASAAAERKGIQFDRVVNAVDDLGLDPTGSETVHETLDDVESGTLVQFPEGDYRFDGRVYTSSGTYGFESIGSQRATLVVEEGYNDWLFGGHGSEGVYLKGFNIDQTAPETNGCLRIIGDRLHIEDIEFQGRADIWEDGGENMLNCSVEDPDGYGEIRNVVSKHGHWARYGPGSSGRMGIYTGRRHEGTLKVVDCDLREFGNNAMYCSKNWGEVQVEDSYFENNSPSSVRIGGEGSYADNCTFVTDPDSYTGPRTYEDSGFTMRCVVIEERFETGDMQKPAGAEVRNCSFRIEENDAEGAAIHRWGNGRSVRIENCVIEYNNDGYPAAILAGSGGFGKNPDADDPKQIEFVNSVLYGTGDVDSAIEIENSDGSVIENSTIYMTGHGQDGVTISGSSDCRITDSTISVPGRATVFDDTDAVTRNLSYEAPDDIEDIEVDEGTDDSDDSDDGSTGDSDGTENESDDEGGDSTDADDDGGLADDGSENVLRIIADDTADAFEYTFTVDGDVELLTEGDYPASSAGEEIVDNDDGTATVSGVVAGYEGDDTRYGGDSFRYVGELTEFAKDGPATVLLNGAVIDPDEEIQNEPRTLRIIADDTADAFEYTFTVDGDVELLTEGDYPASSAGEEIVDNDDGTATVSGIVAGYEGDDPRYGGDSFGVDGSIVSMSLDGPATVTLDDEPIDPAEYGLGRQLTIVGTGNSSNYEITVDGTLTRDPNGSTENEQDIYDGTAEGAVKDGVSSLRFDGEIVDFWLDGDAGVYLDGDQVDPTRLATDEDPFLSNWLVVDGDGDGTDYQFSVDGIALKAPDLGPVEAEDQIEDSLVVGSVTDEKDGYRFRGDLTMLRIRGTADVLFNDE